MYNLKDKINKSKEKIENIKEINRLNSSIEKANSEKLNIFTNAGIKIYEKIRKKEIEQDTIIDLFEGIDEIDKNIYACNLEINNLMINNELICECGNNVNIEDNFCCVCGKSIEYEKTTIICQHCYSHIDEDSIFCGCCGKKI